MARLSVRVVLPFTVAGGSVLAIGGMIVLRAIADRWGGSTAASAAALAVWRRSYVPSARDRVP
jgi:hypothetical protein